MPMYGLSQRTTNVTSANAAWEIRTAGNRVRLMELGLTATAATAQTLGLGRPQAIGTGPTNVLFQDEENTGVASVTNGCLTSSGLATVPLQFFRRVSLPATIGAGMIWTFPRGLLIPINFSVVLWNITSGAVMDVWAVVQESA